MKIAYVYAVSSGTQFCWKWRSATDKEESSATFNYYFECSEDARKHGYEAQFENRDSKGGSTVPRPAEHSVRSW